MSMLPGSSHLAGSCMFKVLAGPPWSKADPLASLFEANLDACNPNPHLPISCRPCMINHPSCASLSPQPTSSLLFTPPQPITMLESFTSK